MKIAVPVTILLFRDSSRSFLANSCNVSSWTWLYLACHNFPLVFVPP